MCGDDLGGGLASGGGLEEDHQVAFDDHGLIGEQPDQREAADFVGDADEDVQFRFELPAYDLEWKADPQ